MEDLGVIKEENKTKKWIRSKVGLSLFVGEQKKKVKRRGRRGEEEGEEEEKRKGMEIMILVWIFVH